MPYSAAEVREHRDPNDYALDVECCATRLVASMSSSNLRSVE